MKIIALIIAMLIATPSMSAEKYLQYKYNDAVTIVISSAACPFPQMQKEHKYAVAAFRIDGEKLAGCYKRFDENMLEIQWHKGDKTVLPANAFLQPNSGVQVPVPEPSL